MEESRSVPFSPAQQVNLSVCLPVVPFNAECQAGKPQIAMSKVLVWPDSESKPSLHLQTHTFISLGHLGCDIRSAITNSRNICINSRNKRQWLAVNVWTGVKIFAYYSCNMITCQLSSNQLWHNANTWSHVASRIGVKLWSRVRFQRWVVAHWCHSSTIIRV